MVSLCGRGFDSRQLHINKSLRHTMAKGFVFLFRTIKTGNEVAAALLKNGDILVFKDGNNKYDESENFFIKIKNKTYVRIGKELFEVTYQVHTHPRYGTTNNILGTSYADTSLARKYFDGQIRLLFTNGKYYEVSINSVGFNFKKQYY